MYSGFPGNAQRQLERRTASRPAQNWIGPEWDIRAAQPPMKVEYVDEAEEHTAPEVPDPLGTMVEVVTTDKQMVELTSVMD